MKKLLATLVLASGLSSTAIAQQNATPIQADTAHHNVIDTSKSALKLQLYGYAELYAQTTPSTPAYQFPETGGLNLGLLGLHADYTLPERLQSWGFEELHIDLAGQGGRYVHANYTGSDTSLAKHIHNCLAQINMRGGFYAKGGVIGSSYIGPTSTLGTDPLTGAINNPVRLFTKGAENTPYYLTGAAIGETLINKDTSQIVVEVWMTNGAQHIIDNNDRIGVGANTQYTSPKGQKAYLCFHYSDEGIGGDKNHQLILEGHGTFTIKSRQVIPARYAATNKIGSRQNLSVTASHQLSKNLLLGIRGEGTYDPQEMLSPNELSASLVGNLQLQDPGHSFTASAFAQGTIGSTGTKTFQAGGSIAYRLASGK